MTRVPPLESGDVLDVREFEARYRNMRGTKAELINGVVFLASPVFRDHSRAHTLLLGWLVAFQSSHPDVEVLTEQSVRLSETSEVQPDAVVRLINGGSSNFDRERFLEGAPELVVEIAVSSRSKDLHTKLRAYEEAGVQEYIVWRVADGLLDWFQLVDGRFELLSPDDDIIVHSRVFPGLRLALDSLLEGDIADVLAVQLGTARQSPR